MALLKITEIAKQVGLGEDDIELYGKYKAKVNPHVFSSLKDKPNGKLVLVTAITPTKAGEGKTTISIGLAEGMAKIGKKAMLCLREPSLGPVFGLKGGATGGGKASIAPAEDINLHFTGDMHALTSSINLISAVIDNSLYQGNPLGIDPERIVWSRALDMNDRSLRDIEVALNDPKATPHHSSFVITVASELMAIFCLAKSEDDFLSRIEKVIVAYTYDDKPITIKDLEITHAIMRLMKEALKPNLVQTLENNPVLVHGGPFANIAHGCNSIIATELALKLAPITITEAGFGADLGAEKFLDIKCREAGFTPDCVVMVATIRALKMHGGMCFEDLETPNVDALAKGVCNLERHLENIKKFGVPVVVAINHFAADSPEEVAFLRSWCESKGYKVAFADVFAKGGEGAKELASLVAKTLDEEATHYTPLYNLSLPLKDKIAKICKEIYRAGSVTYEEKAERQLEDYERLGYSKAYICMAKTPSSFSDDPKLLGAPNNFKMVIREVNLSAGANFVVPLTGKILTMPGLPKIPSAVKMEKEAW
jgi:formate--tetrahydrofolate ligase